MRVLLVRHAEAVDKSAAFGLDDLSRPLSEGGRRCARRAFRRLARCVPPPDVVLSSAAVRAGETARILAQCLHCPQPVRVVPVLNPGARPADLRRVLGALPPDVRRVAVVGHEPDCSAWLAEITADGRLRARMAKGACAEVEMNRIGKGELVFLAPPELLTD